MQVVGNKPATSTFSDDSNSGQRVWHADASRDKCEPHDSVGNVESEADDCYHPHHHVRVGGDPHNCSKEGQGVTIGPGILTTICGTCAYQYYRSFLPYVTFNLTWDGKNAKGIDWIADNPLELVPLASSFWQFARIIGVRRGRLRVVLKHVRLAILVT